jgi:hypothetical protein
MLLLVLFAAGFVLALALASLFRHARPRLVLAALVVVLCGGYAIYIAFAPCPDQGECEKGLTIIFLAAILLGWIAGVATSWRLRRPVS